MSTWTLEGVSAFLGTISSSPQQTLLIRLKSASKALRQADENVALGFRENFARAVPLNVVLSHYACSQGDGSYGQQVDQWIDEH
jgi:hypothetical protein